MERLFLGLAVALVVTLMATPIVRFLAVRFGAFKHPVGRSIHTRPVPHLGGIAMVVGTLVGLLVFDPHMSSAIQGLLWGGLLIAFVGAMDDLFVLPPWAKFLGQIAAALVLVSHGGVIQWLTNPFGNILYTGFLAIPLTVFWIVAVANCLNFSDGLDGLAAGLSAIVAMTVMIVSLFQQDLVFAGVAAVILGSSIGFLRYNFNPATIFMGDTGSLFLGFMLAGLAVVGTLKDTTMIALGVPILALGLPIFDTAFAIVRRTVNHQSSATADREHIHYRLLDLGLSQRQAVLLLYLASIFLGLSAIVMTEFSLMEALPLLTAVVGALVWAAKRKGLLSLHHMPSASSEKG